MSDIDKQTLRKAAIAATGGQWVFSRSGVNSNVQVPIELQKGGRALVVLCKLNNAGWSGQIQTENNAKFIAAANPETVLALLDDLEADKKRIAELSASHGKLREVMAGIHNTIRMDGGYTPLAAILNAAKRAYDESSAAAGIGMGE